MKKFMIKNKKGFTLIELIIVMAIIGILAVVAVVAIGSKSADARDARRLADMSAVRTAMALSCAEQDATDIGWVDGSTVGTTATNPVLCALTGSDYITFTNIQDPQYAAAACNDDTEGCSDGDTTDCDYGFSTTTPAFCDYRINFLQENTTDLDGYAADEGLVE